MASDSQIPDHFPDDFDLDTGAGQIMSDEEYIEWYAKKLEREKEEEPPPQAIIDTEASIGDLVFRPDFADPTIELSHDRETHDHEIVNGHTAYRDRGVEFVVQAMGRNAPTIDVTAWILKDQLEKADKLVEKKRVQFISDRWSGIVAPLRVDVDYSREFHSDYGWIYEATFELLGTNRDTSLEAIERSDNPYPEHLRKGANLYGHNNNLRNQD